MINLRKININKRKILLNKKFVIKHIINKKLKVNFFFNGYCLKIKNFRLIVLDE